MRPLERGMVATIFGGPIVALLAVALMPLCGCPVEPTVPPETTTGGFEQPPQIRCPGDIQCAAPCAPNLRPGPTGACTRTCRSSADCHSLVVGRLACLGGWCGIPCDETALPDGGCSDAVHPDSVCIGVESDDSTTWACGYDVEGSS